MIARMSRMSSQMSVCFITTIEEIVMYESTHLEARSVSELTATAPSISAIERSLVQMAVQMLSLQSVFTKISIFYGHARNVTVMLR